MNLPLFLNASNAWRISLMEAGAAENSSISKYIPLIFSFLEALSIANRAYVLETGKIIMSGNASELANNEEIKKAYLGG